MSNEKNIIPAAELRAMQERRETEERQREQQKRQASFEASQRADEEEERRQAKVLQQAWPEMLNKAAEQTGVRFAVIAQVINETSKYPNLQKVIDEIRAAGYQVTCGGGLSDTPPQARHGHRQQPASPALNAGAIVYDGNICGFRPAGIPSFGGNGIVQWLVVKW